MGDKKLTHVTSSRFLGFVERFLEWQSKNSRNIKISYVLNYTSNFDRPTLSLVQKLDERFPSDNPPLRGVTLGGLPWRPDNSLHEWLLERQQFGCETVHASLAGTGAVHDYWNGRPGDFELILRTLKIAANLGMSLGTRLLVTKSTLPFLEDLMERLEVLPKNERNWQYALPLFYAGWAARHEQERIDENIRDQLPSWFKPLIKRSTGEGYWNSEREWIERIRNRPALPRNMRLILNVTDDNIHRLETESCDSIIEEFAARTSEAYSAIPNITELCERYGDRENRNIYALERCVEMKWLDLYLAGNPVQFERQLTHLQMGN